MRSSAYALLDPGLRRGTNLDPPQQRPRHSFGIRIQHDLPQHPRRGRGHLLRHLVGLELDQWIVFGDRIADLLEPRANYRLGPFLLVGDADLDHQNPTSRSISARMLVGEGSAHSIRLG